jgi:hypothetical protein
LRDIDALLQGVNDLKIPLNLWKAQNIFFNIIKAKFYEILESKKESIEDFKTWQEFIKKIGGWLQVGVNHENS